MTDTSSEQMNETRASVKFALTLEGWADATFLVSEWQGREVLAQPYRLEILLASRRSDVTSEQMLGSRATFTVSTPGEKPRSFHGLVTAAEQLDRTLPYTFYRIRLEPRFAALARYRYTEVYLGKTLPDLVSQVLKDCGLRQGDDGDFQLRVHRDHYPAHNFVCQYEETCLDFVSRRLERGGMYYYFDQSGERERVVFCDDAFFEPPFETAGATGWYRPQRDIDPDHPPVLSITRRSEALPEQVALADYSGGHAQRQRLEASHAIAGGGEGRWVAYGEHFNTDRLGKRLAQVRAEALAIESPRISGRSEVSSLSAGYPLELRDHFQTALNTRYRILEVHHEGRQTLPELVSRGEEEGYHNRFVAMPLDKPYRTPRRTAIPHVSGMMSAVVDGEGDSDKAYIDEYGRYRVRLPVDHSAKPDARGSAWVRRATPYAGSTHGMHGMHFPLLKGTEVLLAFINGNPDRPVIVNALPNSENPSIVTEHNARENRLQTANGNTLIMDDDPTQPTTTLAVPGAGYWTLGQFSKASNASKQDRSKQADEKGDKGDQGEHGDEKEDADEWSASGDEGSAEAKDVGYMCEFTAEHKKILGASEEVYKGQHLYAVLGLHNDSTIGVKTVHEAAYCLKTNLTRELSISKEAEEKRPWHKETVGDKNIKAIKYALSSTEIEHETSRMKYTAIKWTATIGDINWTVGGENSLKMWSAGFECKVGSENSLKISNEVEIKSKTDIGIQASQTLIMAGNQDVEIMAGEIINISGDQITMNGKACDLSGDVIRLG